MFVAVVPTPLVPDRAHFRARSLCEDGPVQPGVCNREEGWRFGPAIQFVTHVPGLYPLLRENHGFWVVASTPDLEACDAPATRSVVQRAPPISPFSFFWRFGVLAANSGSRTETLHAFE